jgi:hypothetical protein
MHAGGRTPKIVMPLFLLKKIKGLMSQQMW